MSIRPILAVLLIGFAGSAAAAELGFAHYAPGAGTVLVELDASASRVLAYKDFEQVTSFEAGTRHVKARRADGSVIAEGDFELLATDRYIVILAGNGTAGAPFQFRLATDHNAVYMVPQWSLQEANLAITDAASVAASDRFVGQVACGTSPPGAGSTQPFGYGTVALDDPSRSGGVSMREVGTSCVHSTLLAGTVLATTPISGGPGERLRRFFIGDGAAAPYEAVVVSQGSEPILPVMTPDASIEGLFMIDGASNMGLQLTFDPAAPVNERISAVYFGFENDGRASWRTFEKTRFVEYVGGNPDGTRAAVGFDRATAIITPHSCRELSVKVLTQSGPSANQIFPSGPRSTLRLTRLFPPECPPAVPNGQEVTP